MPRTAPQTAGLRHVLPDAAATDVAGAALGRALRPGDAVLLQGPLGAGKSALARAAIATRLADAGLAVGDIPSPTWTLTQTYVAGAVEIWHADLYRLGAADEVWELGLIEAFETAICLVEWPERLGALAPGRALLARLDFEGAGRRLTLTPRGPGWDAALRAAAP